MAMEVLMRFRPCIDLRGGRVVQIVGSTLDLDMFAEPTVNFEAERPPAFYADLYRQDNLVGGHVIALGPGNNDAMKEALSAFPGGLQAGGGIVPENAAEYLAAGASHVIVTSFVFRDGRIDRSRLEAMVSAVGKERLVLDLSCRKRDGRFYVVTDRWQTFTDVPLNEETLENLAVSCDEFLVHGVDVEGKRAGMEEELIVLLGTSSPIPVTYAGGAKALTDFDQVLRLGQGRVDLTMGSCLDIFGGDVAYESVVEWQRMQNAALRSA